MGQKRNPKLVAIAKKLRNEGRSFADIAAELSKKGKTISKATVVNWLRGAETASESPSLAASVPGHPSPAPSAEGGTPPAEPPADDPATEMTPEELRLMLSTQIRKAQTAADEAMAKGEAGEAKAQTKLVAIFSGHLRQIHSKTDEDTDTLRVRTSDVQLAADRALAGLKSTADRVVAEVSTWPRCTACGRPAGRFAAGDVSPIRAMFERVACGG